jgi:hypothetical protein
MSRLLFEEFVPDAGILNLLENKALVLSGAQQIYIKWWPLRQCCIVYDGVRWDIAVAVDRENGRDVTLRMLLRHYEIGGESNTEIVLERGTGLIQNILDTPVEELREEIVLRLCDLSVSMRAEEQVGLSQKDLDAQLRGDGRERVGSEEFHSSDAQIAAHLFGQE